MDRIKQAWLYFQAKGINWIFYCLFQPSRFNKEIEQASNDFKQDFGQAPIIKKVIQFVKLNWPILLCLYFLMYLMLLVYSIILLTLYVISGSNLYTTIFLRNLTNYLGWSIVFLLFDFVPVFPALFFVSFVFWIINKINKKSNKEEIDNATFIACYIVVIILTPFIILAIDEPTLRNITMLSITSGFGFGVVLDIAIGSIKNSKFHGILIAMVLYIIISAYISYTISTKFGYQVGFQISIALLISCLLGYYRIPFYLISGSSGLRAYLASRKDPTQVFTYLHRSALHWDERVHIPLPHLESTLLIAAKQDARQTFEEVTFIASERPLQIRAVRRIYLEIALRDLGMRSNLHEIAEASQQLSAIVSASYKVRLIDRQWMKPFTRLYDASQEATRYYSRIGRRTRLNVLEDMKTNLQEIYLNETLRDNELKSLLSVVVEKWLGIAQQEQEKIENVPQEIGYIKNPYNPGKVLKPGDPLFVGRSDLVQQLEDALRRGDSRPTFLLNGERRIGKTSVIRQFSSMLGTRYFPVYYDLQQRGISSSAARFFESIASEIRDVVIARNIKIDELEYKYLYNASKENEASYMLYSINGLNVWKTYWTMKIALCSFPSTSLRS